MKIREGRMMRPEQWRAFLEFLRREIRPYLLKEQEKVSLFVADVKGRNELVTHVDRTVEEQITDFLQKNIRDFPVMAEESVSHLPYEELPRLLKDSDFWWVVDPLDGTTNYLHRLPCFGVSIALWNGRERRLEVSVVYDVVPDVLFWAIRGGGAWSWGPRQSFPGDVLRVSGHDRIQHYLIATGFPYSDFSRMREYMEAFQIFMRETQGLRRMGSASLDLAYTAAGRFDGFFEYNLKIWDVAGGALLVLEAGGNVSDFSGGDEYLLGKEIVAGNPPCYRYMMERIQQVFVRRKVQVGTD